MRIAVPLLAALVLAAASTAPAVTYDDVRAYYPFDDVAGTAFTDAGPNATSASFYRAYKYNELPAFDVANVSVDDFMWPLDRYIGIGTRQINYVDHQMMVDVPSHANLPGAGDSFAVSFWLSVSDWVGAYGMIASYNVNGLEWSIGIDSSTDSLLAWSGDADTSGTNFAWQASCAGLTPNTLAHFVVQYEGTAGVTNVYVNGAASTDGGNANFWGNEREGFTLGGRVLDSRGYTVLSMSPYLDDFAIIDGVVDSTDIGNLMTSGAAGLGTRRLAHYAMDDTSGPQITDSSANANHGTLIGYEPTTMGRDLRDLAPASRAGGVFGNCVEIASGFGEHARMATVDAMPAGGEAFTVCFWMKPDENNAALYGWDQNGIIFNWSNIVDGAESLGFSVGQHTQLDGGLIVRRTTGDATSPGDEDTYGIFLGAGNETTPGLGLDPTIFHHFAVTVDADGVITGIYVDGNLAAEQYSNGWGVTDEETGVIGCRLSGGSVSTALGGYLDDLVVLSGQLTEAQIELAMNQGVPALWAPLPAIPGDTNNDRIVDATDAKKLAEKWGAPNQTGGASVGDFNNDGKVNAADAAILAANWGDHRGTEGAAVPEPGSFALMLVTAVTAAALRRRDAGCCR